MAKEYDPIAVLASNLQLLKRLQEERGGELTSYERIHKKSGVGKGTVARAHNGSGTAIGIDGLQKLAKVFGLKAWQLLTPNLNPDDPPVLAMSANERAMAGQLRDMAAQLRGFQRNPPPEGDPAEGDPTRAG